MNEKNLTFVIPQGGVASGADPVRMLHSDTGAQMLEAVGETTTRRASDVEPGGQLCHDSLMLLQAQSFGRLVIGGKDGTPLRLLPALRNHWFVDLQKSGLPFLLGPFPPHARDVALQAEHDVLLACGLPLLSNDRPNAQPLPPARAPFLSVDGQQLVELDLVPVEVALLQHALEPTGPVIP